MSWRYYIYCFDGNNHYVIRKYNDIEQCYDNHDCKWYNTFSEWSFEKCYYKGKIKKVSEAEAFLELL